LLFLPDTHFLKSKPSLYGGSFGLLPKPVVTHLSRRKIMSGLNQAVNNKPAAVRRNSNKAPVAVKEKQKPLAFVNWRIADSEDETLLRSSKGFTIFDNEYTTLEDHALVELAEANGGTAIVQAELRIILHQDKPEKLDISKIPVIKK
jgi:hypothetical protein